MTKQTSSITPISRPQIEEHEEDSSVFKSAVLAAAAVALSVSIVNRIIFARTPPLSDRNGGFFDRYPARQGDMAYSVHGSGSAVLLLHGFGAGNSMAEWTENIESLAQRHTVYAFDFLGWGLSDKPKVRHTAEDYIEATLNFLEDVVGEPCALIASSQAANLAVEIAARGGESVSKLILICPSPGHENASSSVPARAMSAILSIPGLNTSLYNFIASRRSIEEFSRAHLYFDKARVDERLVDQFYVAAHQSGAPHGVYAFLSGAFDIDARAAWSDLEQPALLVWGRNALLSPLDSAPEWLALKPDASLEVVDHAMLQPHVEHAQHFNTMALQWLDAAP